MKPRKKFRTQEFALHNLFEIESITNTKLGKINLIDTKVTLLFEKKDHEITV